MKKSFSSEMSSWFFVEKDGYLIQKMQDGSYKDDAGKSVNMGQYEDKKLIEISEDDGKNLCKIDKSQRIKYLNKMRLKTGDLCLVASTKCGIVIGKEWRSGELYLDVRVENQTKQFNAAAEIEIVEKNLVEYFLFTKSINQIDKGSVVFKYLNHVRAYPNCKILNSVDVTDKKVKKIGKKEADEYIEDQKMIKKLSSGEKCYWKDGKNDGFLLIEHKICLQNGSIEFVVKDQEKKKYKRVDSSELSTKNPIPNDNDVVINSQTSNNTNLISQEIKPNTITDTKRDSKLEDLLDKIGIKILNPVKVKEIETINEINKIYKYEKDKFIKVKERVRISETEFIGFTEVIGCRDKISDEYRINGMFFVSIKQMKLCLESDGSHNHCQLNIRGSGVEYESVCCIEVMDRLVEYSWIRVHSELSKGDKKYKCKWIGKMNGEDIVGIESNKRLLIMNKNLSNLVVPGNEKLIFYQASTFKYGMKKSASLECNIIDPTVDIGARNMKEIEASKIVYVYVGNDRKRGVVKMTGNVNGNEIVGCEMDKEFHDGTDGIFRETKLFDCGDKRGVLIVQDDKLRCCEVYGRHNDVVMDRNGRVDETSFCCLDNKKKVEGYEKVVVGQSYSWNNGKRWIVSECDWIGIVNGSKKVGRINKPDKEGLIFNLWRTLMGNKADVYIGLNKINTDITLCDVINILIIKPESILSYDDNSGEVINKYLIITTQDKKNLAVKAKWRGSVQGSAVIGCELKKKSKYGTNGEFNGHKLFTCEDGKGILMVLEGFTKTCANGSHKELEFERNKMIKEECICCIEHGDWRTSQFIEEMKVKVDTDTDTIRGICRWIGKINNQSCVGIELDVVGESIVCNGNLFGIELFECKRGCGYFIMEESIEHEIKPRKSERFKVGDMIQSPDLYGKILSLITLENEPLIKLKRIDLNQCNSKECYIKETELVSKCYVENLSSYYRRCLLFPESVVWIDTSPIRCDYEINSRINFVITGFKSEEFEISGIMRGCILINNEPFIILDVDDKRIKLDNFSRCLITEQIKKIIGVKCRNCVLLSLVAFNEQTDFFDMKEREMKYNDSFNKYVMSWRRGHCCINSRILIKSITSNVFPIQPSLYNDILQLLLENEYYNIFKLILNNILQITSDLFNYDDIKLFLHFICQILLHSNSSQLEILEIILSIFKLEKVKKVLDTLDETCLTYIIRNLSHECDDTQDVSQNLPEDIQNQIINLIHNNSDVMDLNRSNKDGDTALILACKTSSLHLMEYMIGSNIVDFTLPANRKAVDVANVINADRIHEPQFGEKIFKILRMLNVKLRDLPEATASECKICFVRNVNMVFQCGHMICDICSNDMIKCPFCNKDIEQRIKLYFN